MSNIIEFPAAPGSKVLSFPNRYNPPVPPAQQPRPNLLQDQLNELMWAQNFLAEEITAINRTLIRLVQVLKEST